MHPAFSVIFFTTASGAGYGMLAILAVLAASGIVPLDRTFGMVGLGLAFVLVTAGLLSSMGHLGHPERAWRAMTQWRSSWLSREGVLSIMTFGPWALLAYFWILEGDLSGIGSLAAAASAVLAVVTIYCTAMIYRSLKTIHHWSNKWTTSVYIVLGIATGAVWVAALMSVTVGTDKNYLTFAVAAVVLASLVKRTYWKFVDTTNHPSTSKSATGLKGETVTMLEGPHTEENYLMQEMGFKVGRKHAKRLRGIVRIFGFLAPASFLVLAYLFDGTLASVACFAAAVSISIGVITERWLFFAEARHVVTLYYGAETA